MEVKIHPISDLIMATSFPEFISELSLKLRKGADEYGDSSFSRPAQSLARELGAEALDIAGWGFILWKRLKYLELKLSDLEGVVDKKKRTTKISLDI